MTEPTDTPAPAAPPVDLMEQLGLRLRVSFPEFLALDDGPQAERKKRAEQE